MVSLNTKDIVNLHRILERIYDIAADKMYATTKWLIEMAVENTERFLSTGNSKQLRI